MKAIDGRPLSFGDIIEETTPLATSIENHTSHISYNIIHSPSTPVILGLSWLERFNPNIDWSNYNNIFPATRPPQSLRYKPLEENKFKKPLFIGARAFIRAAKVGSTFVIYATPIANETRSMSTLPEQYKSYQDVFEKKNVDILPQHRLYDCAIDIEDGAQVPFGPIYNMSQDELATLKEYIDENFAKGFIRHSKSPASAPIFFVKKKDGSLRMCMDYRGLNKVTIKNQYPLPLISRLLNQLGQAKIYTKIDLRRAYNLVRVREGDEWKTAFRTRYGHFEYLVMPFGLTNAPAIFQHLMNDIFQEFLDNFIICYLDDILIYSIDINQHEEHVRLVLDKLCNAGLYAKLEKCNFHQSQVEFLGYIVSCDGMSMDQKKVQVVLEWETPKTIHDVQCFLGFANFYRIFIKSYSKIAAPLTRLTCKDKLDWNSDVEKAFQLLKTAFTTAPVLVHPDFSKPFFMETDASDFALGVVLLQLGDGEKLHPLAFHSQKFSAVEINYEIHDKELLAIVDSFQEWRHLLEGATHQVTVYIDHKNLEYFMSTRILNRRQTRWNMPLSRFDFEIVHRSRKQQGLSEALSRRSNLIPKEGEAAYDQQRTTLLKPKHLCLRTTHVSTPADTTFLEEIRATSTKDPLVLDIQHHRSNNIKKFSYFRVEDNLLYFEERLYVPSGSRLSVLQTRYDLPIGGHFGFNKTLELVSRDFW